MFAAILASVLLLGQVPDGPASHDREGVVLKLPDKLRPIMDMVGAAPPEFGASALARMLESGAIDDPPTRRELTERTFQLAALAHDGWRVRAMPGAGLLAATRALAGKLELDRLSLQARAVRLMLPLHKRRARDLFLEIPKPAPEPLTCDDWVGADLGDFYSTLGRVVDQTFTPAEKRHEDDIHLAIDYLGAITSPLQFQPALRMVLGLDVKPEQRQLLLVKLGSAMAAVSADDRSFASVSAALTPDLPTELVPAFQRFVVSHGTASRCVAPDPANNSEAQSDEEKRIASDEMNLMFTRGTLVSRTERAGPEFQQHLEDFLDEMAGWRQSPDEPDATFYHRRMSVYQGLLDVTSGALRARLIDDMVQFALSSGLERDAPAEWFLELKTADERVRWGSVPGPDVLNGFERSGHPVLVLAAALERALGK
jgi:hypothetical protein